ncbi:MAG: DUF2520 domain-containing protein [Chitinophagaceae bacterium]|nr:DUF2520 domain-containing protein [Chitinophagaceae bacterium]
MKISILGSGNIGSFYGQRFYEAGHTILQVLSRNPDHANQLASVLHAEAITTLNELNDEADVYLLAVSDNALNSFIELFPFKEKFVLFASGSISMNDLKGISKNYGCIWCLYSIRKEQLPEHKNIPIFIQSNSETHFPVCHQLAEALSVQTEIISDEQKLALHVSAVFVNNFPNHLASIAERILKENRLSLHHLQPIMLQTIEKLQNGHPYSNQTGPALRGDTQVLEKHSLFLSKHPDWLSIYQKISDSIVQLHMNRDLPSVD